MEHSQVQEKFLDLLEDQLCEAERVEIKSHISSCKRCSLLFAEYKTVAALGQQLSLSPVPIRPEISEKVVARIEAERGFLRRILKLVSCVQPLRPRVLVPIATGLVVCLTILLSQGHFDSGGAVLNLALERTKPANSTAARPPVAIIVAARRLEQGTQVQSAMLGFAGMPPEQLRAGMVTAADESVLVGKFVSQPVEPGEPVTLDKVVAQLTSAIDIPPGFRAVTVNVDTRTGVEGWAKSNSRVSVHWSYRDRDGTEKVATIVPFTKILSVAGITGSDSQSGRGSRRDEAPVTLLVGEKDAQKIDLARKLGTLTLSLVGDKDPGTKPALEGESITVDDLINNPPISAGKGPEKADGRMYATDPKTGKSVCYILRTGAWKLCDEVDKEVQAEKLKK